MKKKEGKMSGMIKKRRSMQNLYQVRLRRNGKKPWKKRCKYLKANSNNHNNSSSMLSVKVLPIEHDPPKKGVIKECGNKLRIKS